MPGRNTSASPDAPSFSSFSNTSMGPRRGCDGRGRGQGQWYVEGTPNGSRGVGAGVGGGGDRRPYSSPHRGGGASLLEAGPRTKLSSYMTPHDAVQAQPAQHGASVVRSGSAATEGGSILFFSSVQKKGGAFTASERETYAQLRQSRAIPNSSRGGRGGNVVGSGIMTRNVARQFEELEKSRAAKEVGDVRRAVVASKRSRFALVESDEDVDEEEGESSDEDSVEEETEVKVAESASGGVEKAKEGPDRKRPRGEEEEEAEEAQSSADPQGDA